MKRAISAGFRRPGLPRAWRRWADWTRWCSRAASESRRPRCAPGFAQGLGFLGIELEEKQNVANEGVISAAASRVAVRVMHTDEELHDSQDGLPRSRPWLKKRRIEP